MTITVEPIKTIRLGETVYNVEECSEKVQHLVEFYNDWRETEAQQRSNLLATQAGIRQISNEILNQLQADIEAAAKAEAAANADVADVVDGAENSEAPAAVDEAAPADNGGGESA